MNNWILIIKACHIIAMVAWFAGLFYLPRLFVYHAVTTDHTGLARFKLMESRLYYGIMWPAGLLTTVFGIALIISSPYYLKFAWMHAKLSLVILLWLYHLCCGRLNKRFAVDNNRHSARFYRIFNEVPTILLISIVLLVVVHPF